MSNRDYRKCILDSLLKKYNNRYIKNINTNRRIILKPTEVYKNYTKNNAEIAEKQCLNEAISELIANGFISVDYLKFSDDIEKVYLCEDKVDDIYEYLEEAYGVVPHSMLSKQVKGVVKKYICAGEIVQQYCNTVLAQIDDPRFQADPERIEANLKMLSFLEQNSESLYVREVSMLVYGDSKWFENNNYDEICAFLKSATGMTGEESEINDDILKLFHVALPEQEIFIKGDWKIEWEQYSLDTSKFQGGVAISSNDIQGIKNIIIKSSCLMTIENKTSFQRLKNIDCAMMYLGGFANRSQIQFLKKVISDNSYAQFLHFGDIDIGGFLIHKHLCRETSKDFVLYCMGVQQLRDERFKNCLRGVTDNDISRLDLLAEDTKYSEVLTYMKEYNVKLEQEIISYYLDKDN